MIKHESYSESNSISTNHLENQDSLLIDEEHLVFAVADGVGGYARAKDASSFAVEALKQKIGAISTEKELRSCIEEIHRAMLARALELRSPLMGTTIAVSKIIEKEKKILSANVGDSSIFLIRGLEVTPLYHDDSQRSEDPSDTWSLTQYLGFSPGKLHVNSNVTSYREGDIMVLCSDGITDNILGRDANFKLFSELANKKSASELVKKAIEANIKRDDMSAILLFF